MQEADPGVALSLGVLVEILRRDQVFIDLLVVFAAESSGDVPRKLYVLLLLGNSEVQDRPVGVPRGLLQGDPLESRVGILPVYQRLLVALLFIVSQRPAGI